MLNEINCVVIIAIYLWIFKEDLSLMVCFGRDIARGSRFGGLVLEGILR